MGFSIVSTFHLSPSCSVPKKMNLFALWPLISLGHLEALARDERAERESEVRAFIFWLLPCVIPASWLCPPLSTKGGTLHTVLSELQ